MSNFPSIYDFPDFASFFDAACHAAKESKPQFSFKWLSQRLGVKSKSTLAMVARGERLPSPNLLHKICDFLELSQKEIDYATALLSFQKAKTARERQRFGDKLKTLKPNPQILLEIDQIDFVCDWWNIAIYVMADLVDFRPDPHWISKRLRNQISTTQAHESLDLLLRLGLLQRKKGGKVVKTDREITTPANIPSDAIKQFHRHMFKQAEYCLKHHPIDERYFFGSTMTIKKTEIPKAAELIREFEQKFRKVMVTDPGEEVYHMAVQFFGVTK